MPLQNSAGRGQVNLRNEDREENINYGENWVSCRDKVTY